MRYNVKVALYVCAGKPVFVYNNLTLDRLTLTGSSSPEKLAKANHEKG